MHAYIYIVCPNKLTAVVDQSHQINPWLANPVIVFTYIHIRVQIIILWICDAINFIKDMQGYPKLVTVYKRL